METIGYQHGTTCRRHYLLLYCGIINVGAYACGQAASAPVQYYDISSIQLVHTRPKRHELKLTTKRDPRKHFDITIV